MDKLKEKNRFDKLAAALGSPYAAVRFITQESRKLTNKYNNCILDSEAISWVITGEKPKSAYEYEKQIALEKRIQSISTKYIQSAVDECLSYVDDAGVCKSVRTSIKASKQARHLVYIYIDLDNEWQHSRVRSLTRMIWYSL